MQHDFCWWCLRDVKAPDGDFDKVFCSKKCLIADGIFESHYKGGDLVPYTSVPRYTLLPFPWEDK